MRMRSAATGLALVAGLGLALTGCGQLGQIRAMKAFKDGNKLYSANDFRGAAEKYEEAVGLSRQLTLRLGDTPPAAENGGEPAHAEE